MATNFPGALDDFAPNPTPTDPRNNPSLAGKITDLSDAVEAIEVSVGVDNSADTSSLQYRVDALENAPVPSANNGSWPSEASGFDAWTFDPAFAASAAATVVAGTLQVSALWLPSATNLTSLFVFNTNTGAATAYGAIYNAAGTLLATSAAQSTNWTASTMKTFTFSSTPVSSGLIYVAFWINAGLSFLSANGGDNSAAATNMNLSAANSRFATANTGLTTTAPATIGAKTAVTRGIWMAVT
jgi:hypothetical protein